MTLTLIAGGTVYDPANGVDGEVRDLWIEAGRIAPAPADPARKPDRVIRAAGLVVMPGGIDMHCHIAGPKVNAARRMRPEEKRRDEPIAATNLTRGGTLGSVPSTFVTGYKYAALGYTTAIDAAVAPIAARHVHAEFGDTPCLDKGFLALVGNNHYLLEAIGRGEPERVRGFLAWLLGAARAYGAKIVNPGGVEVWKQKAAGNVHGLDDAVAPFDVTPRAILRALTTAVDELRLPHAAHIHCNELGMPGNWRTTLETMRALEGRRGHLTHIQFHSYGGGEADETTFSSQVAPLAEYVNSHPNLTVDVGQVLFGETTSMTGDGPLGHFLAKLYGGKWLSKDIELEAGCGITPIKYKNRSLVHALQWAIGLEWYLLVDDPWRVVMSTDHPNGGSFLAYPQIVRLLMDRDYRREVLSTCPKQVRELSTLADLDRQYSLYEIAIITRAGPARALGMTHKGHLGIGADADVTIYTPDANRETMFELPRVVMKAGEIIVEEGEIRSTPSGSTMHVAPAYDEGLTADFSKWFDEHATIRFANYPVDDQHVASPREVACDAAS